MGYKSRLNVKKMTEEYRELVGQFNSGNQYLDDFLKSSLALDDNIGKTYLLLTTDDKSIVGYYNIGLGSVDQIKGNVRVKMGGAFHINCFAIDIEYHKQEQTQLRIRK